MLLFRVGNIALLISAATISAFPISGHAANLEADFRLRGVLAGDAVAQGDATFDFKLDGTNAVGGRDLVTQAQGTLGRGFQDGLFDSGVFEPAFSSEGFNDTHLRTIDFGFSVPFELNEGQPRSMAIDFHTDASRNQIVDFTDQNDWSLSGVDGVNGSSGSFLPGPEGLFLEDIRTAQGPSLSERNLRFEFVDNNTRIDATAVSFANPEETALLTQASEVSVVERDGSGVVENAAATTVRDGSGVTFEAGPNPTGFTIESANSRIEPVSRIIDPERNIRLTETGLTEEAPLLPDNIDGDTFEFSAPFPNDNGNDTIYIDPPVSTGFDFSVQNAVFDTVTAPSFATVSDADGFQLNFGSQSIDLATGQMFDFSNNPDTFSITGIDPGLGLNPNNPQAFPTGVSLANQGSNVNITMTPRTTDVPAPSTIFLLGAGLVGVGLIARQRTRPTDCNLTAFH